MNWTHEGETFRLQAFPQLARTRSTLVHRRLVRADWPDMTLLAFQYRYPGKPPTDSIGSYLVSGLPRNLDDPVCGYIDGLCLGDEAQNALDDGETTLPEAFWNTDFVGWQGSLLANMRQRVSNPRSVRRCLIGNRA